MPLNNPTSNASNASEYQVSGVPYVTSSHTNAVGNSTAVKLEFPNVTQWISVFNTGAQDLHVGFSENGVKGTGLAFGGTLNRFTLPKPATNNGNQARIENYRVRVKELWFLGGGNSTDFQVIAGLTTVDKGNFPALTGSDGLVGIG
jgi:hypothetical protein